MSQRLLRLPRVIEITGLKRTQILDAVREGRMPRPVVILEGGRAQGWVESEIAAYVEARIAARDSEPAKAKADVPHQPWLKRKTVARKRVAEAAA